LIDIDLEAFKSISINLYPNVGLENECLLWHVRLVDSVSIIIKVSIGQDMRVNVWYLRHTIQMVFAVIVSDRFELNKLLVLVQGALNFIRSCFKLGNENVPVTRI